MMFFVSCRNCGLFLAFVLQTAADGIISSAATYSYDAHAQQIRFRNYLTVFNETIPMDLLMHFKQVTRTHQSARTRH